MSKKTLDFESIKYMTEKVCGSFSFSILDSKDNLYLVKGDSPLHVLHFSKSKIYVYASTESIVFKAIVDTPLFKELKLGDYVEIDVLEGDILKITPSGKLEKSRFDFSYYFDRGWWEYDLTERPVTEAYIEDLKYMAAFQGIEPEEVDELIKEGFSLDEIEEYLYGM